MYCIFLNKNCYSNAFVVFEFAKHELHQMEKKSAINETDDMMII